MINPLLLAKIADESNFPHPIVFIISSYVYDEKEQFESIKNSWGSLYYWSILHTISLLFPQSPTMNERYYFQHYFNKLVKSGKIDLGSRASLGESLLLLHNEENERLHKLTYTSEQYKQYQQNLTSSKTTYTSEQYKQYRQNLTSSKRNYFFFALLALVLGIITYNCFV